MAAFDMILVEGVDVIDKLLRDGPARVVLVAPPGSQLEGKKTLGTASSIDDVRRMVDEAGYKVSQSERVVYQHTFGSEPFLLVPIVA